MANTNTASGKTFDDYPPHDPDAEPCRCIDCSEAAWDRLQETQSESPSEWNRKGPIDKREMRRRE